MSDDFKPGKTLAPSADNPAELQRMVRPGPFVSGLVERARVGSATKLVRAQQLFAAEVAALWRALGDVDQARLEKGRAIRLLEDAETVYAYDAKGRATRLLQAGELHEEEQSKARIRKMEREMEEAEVAARYEQFKRGGARSGSQPEVSEEPTRAQREFKSDLDHALDVQRYELEEEAKIKTYVDEHGGWDNLSERQREVIQGIRDTIAQLKKDSGLA